MELILASLLLICATMSGSEVAIFSLTRLKLKKIKNDDPAIFETISNLRKRPQDLLAGILFGNELVNVAVALTVGVLVAKYLPNHEGWVADGLKIFFGTFLIVIIGDITPKILASQNSLGFLKLFLPFLNLFMKITFPIRRTMGAFVDLIIKRPKQSDRFDEEELMNLVEEGRNIGSIAEEQQSLIKSTLQLDDVIATKAMTSKENIIWVESNASVGQALRVFSTSNYSRLPVYDVRLKEPVGVLRFKDFLPFLVDNSQHGKSITDFVQKPLFVSSRFTLNRILLFFRIKRNHMAFVISAKGEYLGLITLEDVVRNIKQQAAQPEKKT